MGRGTPEEEEVAAYIERQVQRCTTCGHARGVHFRNAVGLLSCVVVNFHVGPPYQGCRCAAFRGPEHAGEVKP